MPYSRGDRDYSETLRAILNAGYRLGGVASLCVKTGGDYGLKDFQVFAPKALAGIGKLPDTVSDRSISIELRRKGYGENVKRLRLSEVQAEAAPIKERLERWGDLTVPALERARPHIPEELDDRAADVWEPLLAIADSAGGDWPKKAREAALALSDRAAREDDSLGVVLLRDIWVVFQEQEVARMSSTGLVAALAALEEAPWGEVWGKPLDARRLAKILKPYSIKPHVVRIGDKTPSGYDRSDFGDAWSRYLPSENPQQGQHLQPSFSSRRPNVGDVEATLGNEEEVTEWTA